MKSTIFKNTVAIMMLIALVINVSATTQTKTPNNESEPLSTVLDKLSAKHTFGEVVHAAQSVKNNTEKYCDHSRGYSIIYGDGQKLIKDMHKPDYSSTFNFKGVIAVDGYSLDAYDQKCYLTDNHGYRYKITLIQNWKIIKMLDTSDVNGELMKICSA